MLDVLKTDRTRLTLALVEYLDETSSEGNVLPSRGSRTTGQPNQFVYLRTTLLNQTREFYLPIIFG